MDPDIREDVVTLLRRTASVASDLAGALTDPANTDLQPNGLRSAWKLGRHAASLAREAELLLEQASREAGR